jgi:riboflavin kinase/FMN adenylyltransferase
MRIYRGTVDFTTADAGRPVAPALAIGNFDGVHLGHQALLRQARTHAAARGVSAGVLTFDPHPARVLAPALAPPMLMSTPRRLELLAEAGADFAVVLPFDAALAAMEAETFVDDVLVGALGAGDVVVGYDFSFGRKRRGDGALLTARGAARGFRTTIVPPVTVDGLTCSSTKIREFVLEGRVEGAHLLLGRPFEIEGPVVRGAGRGRGIGIPTANLQAAGDLLPRAGVYAARAWLPGKPVALSAAVNIGTNPTFTPGTGAPLTVEAHLLDFDRDLYGARLRLGFVARLRDERRFAGPDELVAVIRNDIARARELLP